MRQPMEDKVVTISRAKGSLTFSANFQLIAAMNPCPCGYYGDSQKPCTCAHALVTKYQKRISGPLLDWTDIHIEVPRVDYEKLSADRRENRAKQSVPAFELRAIFNAPDLPIRQSANQELSNFPTSSVMRTCTSPR
jgi:magnesium chelatase family protein